MGLHDRDYVRDSPQEFGSSGISSASSWGVTQKLIAITVVAFIAQILFPEASRWFVLSPDTILQGQVWRLLSYAFLHDVDQILHIVFNMFLLYVFGKMIESMYGGKEFALFYCASAMFAGLCYVGWGLFLQQPNAALGASGGVMAVVILFALHFPRQKMLIWGLFPVEMRWIATFIVVIDLLPVLQELSGNPTLSATAHMAHLGGVLFAYLYYKGGWRLSHFTSKISDKAPNFSSLGKGPQLKVYRGDNPENLDEEVDRILQKINDQGEASLTKKERRILTQASETYKNRRS